MISVSFRVVGIYCYFENLQLDLQPTATVKEVMEAIQNKGLRFSFETGNQGKNVTRLSYDYQTNGNPPSKRPSNTGDTPSDGERSMQEEIVMGPGQISRIWQYYRSITTRIEGKPFEIKTISSGQPSFATTRLNKDVVMPPGSSENLTYNLTWRLVSIQLSAPGLNKRKNNY